MHWYKRNIHSHEKSQYKSVSSKQIEEKQIACAQSDKNIGQRSIVFATMVQETTPERVRWYILLQCTLFSWRTSKLFESQSSWDTIENIYIFTRSFERIISPILIASRSHRPCSFSCCSDICSSSFGSDPRPGSCADTRPAWSTCWCELCRAERKYS